MAFKQIPKIVKGAKPKKLSTQLFDYQIELVSQLSKSSGWSSGIIYRAALDCFIISFKDDIESCGADIPEELKVINPGTLKNLNNAIDPKSGEIEEKKLQVLLNELSKKQNEIDRLIHTVNNNKVFLGLDNESQIKVLVTEYKGEFYSAHKRWPKSQEDIKLLERQCGARLPQIKKEREVEIQQLTKERTRLIEEVGELKRVLNKKK